MFFPFLVFFFASEVFRQPVCSLSSPTVAFSFFFFFLKAILKVLVSYFSIRE